MAFGSLNPHLSQIWWVFLLKGLAGIILGFMLLTEPAATLVALTTLLGFYWLVLAPIFHRPIQIVGSIFANWRVMSHFRQVHGAVGL